MSVLNANHPRRPAPDRDEPTFLVRVIYRDSAGEIHLDWAADRIKEAVDDAGGTIWVDILDPESKDNASAESLLKDVFEFHPLAIDDALKESHVPRVDDWETYLYLVFHSIDFDPDTDQVRLHELDVFLGPQLPGHLPHRDLELSGARPPEHRARRRAPALQRRRSPPLPLP